jgi:hypothetical protein
MSDSLAAPSVSRRPVAAVLGWLMVLAVAFPVRAEQLPPRTGERLNLFAPPATMAADATFWLGHGWCTQETDEDPLLLALNPGTRVDFYIDGDLLTAGTDVEIGTFTELGQACVAQKISYVNFRFGLPVGNHLVEGCWLLLGELQFCRRAEVLFE